MALCNEIADVLEAQFPSFGSVGASVFTHHMPPSPDEAYSVHQLVMAPPIRTMTRTVAEALRLQIPCRASSRQAAEDNCNNVFDLLKQVLNTDLDSNTTFVGTARYLGILARKAPDRKSTRLNSSHIPL